MKRLIFVFAFIVGCGSSSDGNEDGGTGGSGGDSGMCTNGCPDDGDPCTNANLNMSTCMCTQVPITAFIPGDGCCPDGATMMDDSDCVVGDDCGNNVIDAGEQCDDGGQVDGDGCDSMCQIEGAEYVQSFESFAAGDPPQDQPTDLANDGWMVGANVFESDGTTFIYNYFAFPAPNGGPGFSAIATGQGGLEQGNNQLSIYNDYNNAADHGMGRRVEAIVFRERDIVAADEGNTIDFSFDAKRGNINDAADAACTGSPSPPCDSTALAFIKTVDPNDSFATTNFITEVMTAIPDTWGRFSMSLDIDAALVGQKLQVGFQSTASDFEPSGIIYDNLVVTNRPTP